MADISATHHGLYLYRTNKVDEQGKPIYDVVYFENDITDVKIVPFSELSDLDAIPDIDNLTDSALELLQVLEARTRKLDRDKVDKSDTATTATPNKLLYLDANGELQATVQNALQLGGIDASQFALKTDVPSAFDDDGHLVSPAGWTLWITDEDPGTVVVQPGEEVDTPVSG